MYRVTTSAVLGPDLRDEPLGCGVTATDWRLYTADHRHIDGGGNQTAQEKPRGLPQGFRFSGRMGNETRLNRRRGRALPKLEQPLDVGGIYFLSSPSVTTTCQPSLAQTRAFAATISIVPVKDSIG